MTTTLVNADATDAAATTTTTTLSLDDVEDEAPPAAESPPPPRRNAIKRRRPHDDVEWTDPIFGLALHWLGPHSPGRPHAEVNHDSGTQTRQPLRLQRATMRLDPAQLGRVRAAVQWLGLGQTQRSHQPLPSWSDVCRRVRATASPAEWRAYDQYYDVPIFAALANPPNPSECWNSPARSPSSYYAMWGRLDAVPHVGDWLGSIHLEDPGPETLMVEAAAHGWPWVLRRALQVFRDDRQLDANGHFHGTPLTVCISHAAMGDTAGHVACLRILLEADQRPWLPDKLTSALRFAVGNQRRDAVAVLLSDPRVVYTNELTMAVNHNDVATIRTLMTDPRASAHLAENNGALVRYAIEHGHADVVAELVKDPQTHPFRNEWVALAAFESSYADPGARILEILLADPAVDPSHNGNEALHFASTSAAVRILLADARVDPTSQNNVALVHAVTEAVRAIGMGEVERWMDIAWTLLDDPRVDPAVGNQLPLSSSCHLGRLDFVERLLVHPHVDPAANHNTALFKAVDAGHDHIVSRLLRDPRVDPTDPEHSTFIERAADRGHIAVVDVLMRDGRIDPSTHDNRALWNAHRGGTPRHDAIFYRLMEDSRVKRRSLFR